MLSELSNRPPIAITLVLVCAMGCTTTTGPEPEARGHPHPDMTGSWTISVSRAYPAAPADSAAAACEVKDFRITLTSAVDGPLSRGLEVSEYTGSHTGIDMLCAGVEASARAVLGIGDTVVVVPPGDVRASLGLCFCGGFFSPCTPPPTCTFQIEVAGFRFAATHDGIVRPGWFSWSDGIGVVRVEGSWWVPNRLPFHVRHNVETA